MVARRKSSLRPTAFPADALHDEARACCSVLSPQNMADPAGLDAQAEASAAHAAAEAMSENLLLSGEVRALETALRESEARNASLEAWMCHCSGWWSSTCTKNESPCPPPVRTSASTHA